jgi:hypothetical protein
MYGEFCARMGRESEARGYLGDALRDFVLLDQRALTLEVRAVFARFSAGIGDVEAARTHAAEAATLAAAFPVQHFAEQAWHLAATYALLGDSDLARHFAESAAVAFVEAAMRMEADLAEAYSRLPWHRHTIAYLCGRPVPLRLNDLE